MAIITGQGTTAMRRRRRRSLGVVLAWGLAVTLHVTGCAFGPRVLEDSHGQYNEAVKQISEEQLLLSIGRARYNDDPMRLDTPSATEKSSAATNLGPGITAAPVPPDNSAGFDSWAAPQATVHPAFRPTDGPNCFSDYQHVADHSIRQCAHLIWEDHKNFYSWENLSVVGLEIAVAAPLANTVADQHIHEWYQRQVRSPETDRIATVAKQFGEFTYTLPVYVGASLLGRLIDDTAPGSVLEEWGNRSLRAMIVGAPPLGVLQVTLGSGRPDSETSAWRPFHSSHGASGHAFVGSVPFLTAATMTEQLWLQCPLVLASAMPAWSRINDAAHFTSQAGLGWCLGCAAVLSVNSTEREERAICVLPAAPNGEPGVSVQVRY
jgi:hypothetical protein